MKARLFILLIVQALQFGCSRSNPDYNYIKIMSIGSADSATVENNGTKLLDYLYYNPTSDSVMLRMWQSYIIDTFRTSEGHFNNRRYADTIAMLVTLLKQYTDGDLPYTIIPGSSNCGPILYVEYNDKNGSHFNSFTLSGNDTLTIIENFFRRLDKIQWNKKLTTNDRINETIEVVSVLKGLDEWDNIIPPYISLPCEAGIDMEMLYGKWRVVRGQYDVNRNYSVIDINRDGSWTPGNVIDGKMKSYPSVKITVINKNNNSIRVKSKFSTETLIVLTLTENCFEYEHDGKVLRLNRMK